MKRSKKVVPMLCTAVFLIIFALVLCGSVGKFTLRLSDSDGSIIFDKTYSASFLATIKAKLFYKGDYLAYGKEFPTYEFALDSLNESLSEDIGQLAEERKVVPQNATVKFKNGRFYYTPEECGSMPDKQQIFEEILAKLEPETEVKIVYKKLSASITEAELKCTTTELASCYTTYEKSCEGRKANIKIACNRINNSIIASGEVFSFNQKIGSRTEENGYLNSRVIVDGKYTDGIGGGVCQVSTTLYNAAAQAGLGIKEVCHHTLPPSYIEPSLDAMVSGIADLKIYNPTAHPAYIYAHADGTAITVKIFGENTHEGKDIRVVSEVLREIESDGYEDAEGNFYETVPQGATVLVMPKSGYESRAYLVISRGDVTLERRVIRCDIYRPQRGLVEIGNKQ